MNPNLFGALVFLGIDVVVYLISLIITRKVMGMPMRKSMLISSPLGMVAGLLFYLPYLFTHVLNAPK